MRLFSMCSSKKTIWGILTVFLAWLALISPSFAKNNGLQALSIGPDPHNDSGKFVQARVLIQAPPNLVWATITNYRDIKNTLPGYEKSTVIKSTGSTKLLDIVMRVAAFLPAYKYQMQVREDEANYHLSLRRVAGDFKSLNVSYKLLPQNNGTQTLLTYKLNINTGLNLPGSQGLIKTNTEKTLTALENLAEQEARKSLIGQK